MKRMHLIKQHDEKDCGAACLSMVLEYHGKKLQLATVKEAIKVDQYGANIYGLIDGANKYDLNAEALEGSADDLWTAIESGEIELPVIARIVNRDMYEHYVVITGTRHDAYCICDPGEGRYRLPREGFDNVFLGQIVKFEKTDGFKKENRRKGQFRRFTDMILRQSGLLALIALLSAVVTGVGFIGTFIFQFLIDQLPASLTDLEGIDEYLDATALLVTALGILYVFKFLIQMLRGKLSTVMSKRIDLPLMLGYYNHVADLPVNFFVTHKTGEIISRFNDASKIRDAISGATLTLLLDTMMVIVCGFVLHHQSPSLFHVALVLFALYVLTSVFYIKPFDKFNRESMEQNSRINSFLKESIDGMETVKAAQAEGEVKTHTGNLFKKFVNLNIRGGMMGLSKEAIIDLITSVGMLVILWVGVMDVLNGVMTMGALIAFCSLLDYFLSPVQSLVDLQGDLQTALVAADRLNDVLCLESESSGSVKPKSKIKEVAFNNVSFRYGNRELVLDDVSFTLKRGEKLALVGESGSGKSTAAKLLMGMYTPESGDVTVNGVSTRDISLTHLRKRTAYVSQTTFLFSDTVRNNLILGLDAKKVPSDEEIERVLAVCMCDFVKDMPLGVDSMLEENGSNLSGGQRQRLAIARALLRNPQLLILDEATSALDTVTEAVIQKNISELYPNMTMVMVAHRLSTVRQCDMILVMDKGRVVERGSHSDLLAGATAYANLWAMQNGTAA